jgi:hypothetical protein
MQSHNLALLGFGNVGQALARLLLAKRSELQENYHLDWKVVGIATGSHGIAIMKQTIFLLYPRLLHLRIPWISYKRAVLMCSLKIHLWIIKVGNQQSNTSNWH